MRSENPPPPAVPRRDPPRDEKVEYKYPPRDGETPGVYRLRTDHVIQDRVVPAGTLVGVGQEFPWYGPVTNQMEGVDDAGRAEVNKVHQTLYGRDAVWQDKPENDPKLLDEQQKEIEAAAPVSHQQASEQDKEWKGPPPPAPLVLNKGGDATGGASIPQNPSGPVSPPSGPQEPNKELSPKDG